MSRTTAAKRLAGRRIGLALITAAVAMPAMASSANAATFFPLDGPELQAAIITANTNADAYDIIVLGDLVYQPTAPITVSGDMLIRGNPQTQAFQDPDFIQGPTIDGTNVVPTAADAITITAGANVEFRGFSMTTLADIGFATLRVSGNLTLNQMAVQGNTGQAVAVNSSGTVNIASSAITDNLASGVGGSSGSTINIRNSTIARNSGAGVGGAGGGAILRTYNALIANNGASGNTNCTTPNTSNVTSMSNSNGCGTGTTTVANVGFVGFTEYYGGPSAAIQISATSPARNAGTNSECTPGDQRFFDKTDATCDIGSFEVGAVRDLVPPTCGTPVITAGPPRQQTVPATDNGTGIGGRDSVSNVVITNGTTAFSTPVSPGFTVPVTATKDVQGQPTRWGFDVKDFAGNTTHCE